MREKKRERGRERESERERERVCVCVQISTGKDAIISYCYNNGHSYDDADYNDD